MRTTLEKLKELDNMAMEANRLWNKLESFKRSFAKEYGVSDEVLSSNGIYVPENRESETTD